jgi:hypothetical protein
MTKEADLRMMISKKVLGRRFGLLAAFVAALLIACTGVVLAQSSSSTANAGYGNTTVTPSDATQAGAAEPLSNVSSATGDVSAEARVPNGGFETGNFSGWLRANRRLAGEEGNWFVYSGTTSPLNNFAIAAPPQGNFAATTDQSGPGTHVLYRDIHLKRNMKHELSFYLYYDNFANRFFTPNTLAFNLDRNNQQYRVDVLKPTANPFTVNNRAILKTLFQTEVGDPNTRGPQLRTFNLTAFAGKTVRLRFAEVDNQNNFLASVDKVRVASTSR